MKKLQICCIALLFFTGFVSTVEAKQRFIYSKPAFQGRLIDNETKDPIEGVVVVAVYWEFYSFCLNPGGCSPDVIGVVETLTDKKGEFYLKPFKSWMGPFGYMGMIDFIIYKPGYASYPESVNEHMIKPLDLVKPEYFFSQELGKKGEVTYPALNLLAEEKKINKLEIIYGVVELPKLKNREERLKAFPSSPADCRSRELPLLFGAKNKERKALGLTGEER